MRLLRTVATAALCGTCVLLGWAARAAQEQRYKSASGTELRMLVGAAELPGAEVELGEISFVAGADSGEHVHGSTEIFYVLAGELEHVVNGRSSVLKPGSVGFVRPPDRVRHKTGSAGARALVIWAPGGEAARITARWQAVK